LLTNHRHQLRHVCGSKGEVVSVVLLLVRVLVKLVRVAVCDVPEVVLMVTVLVCVCVMELVPVTVRVTVLELVGVTVLEVVWETVLDEVPVAEAVSVVDAVLVALLVPVLVLVAKIEEKSTELEQSPPCVALPQHCPAAASIFNATKAP